MAAFPPPPRHVPLAPVYCWDDPLRAPELEIWNHVDGQKAKGPIVEVNLFTGQTFDNGVLVLTLHINVPGVSQEGGRIGAASMLHKDEIELFGGIKSLRSWPDDWSWTTEEGTLDGAPLVFDVCRESSVCIAAAIIAGVSISLVIRGDYLTQPITLRSCDPASLVRVD